MIIPSDELIEFENNYIRAGKPDYKKNYKIHEAMYKEAVSIGILPLKNPMEDIEVKIQLAVILNSVPENNKKNC